MLTPEECQRIEEEGRKRIAEEHFRAEVRARLQGDSAPLVRKPAGRLRWIIGLAAALVIGTIVLMNKKGQSRTGDDSGTTAQAASDPAPVEKTRYVPVSQKVATGQIVVWAYGYVQYRITITPEMIGPTGNFNASGGSGNDIQAVMADEENYTNWINGHQAQAFWTTQGKQTTGNIEATLKPGMYYLAFSNKFSAFTEKQVFLDVDLNYKKARDVLRSKRVVIHTEGPSWSGRRLIWSETERRSVKGTDLKRDFNTILGSASCPHAPDSQSTVPSASQFGLAESPVRRQFSTVAPRLG